MKLTTLIDKLKNINGVVAISQFGSYGSELWIENRSFDFQHYVLKYARNNSGFEKKLRIDEQCSYFGGIIDESIL